MIAHGLPVTKCATFLPIRCCGACCFGALPFFVATSCAIFSVRGMNGKNATRPMITKMAGSTTSAVIPMIRTPKLNGTANRWNEP